MIKSFCDRLISKSINELAFLSNLILKNDFNKNDNTTTSTDETITNTIIHNNKSANNNQFNSATKKKIID
jgi:hypothetical protein